MCWTPCLDLMTQAYLHKHEVLCFSASSSSEAKGLKEVCGRVCPPRNGLRLLWLKSSCVVVLSAVISRFCLQACSHINKFPIPALPCMTPLFYELGSTLTKRASLQMCINGSWGFRVPFFFSNWNIVYLQCFRCIAKWFSFIYILLKFFSIKGY